MQRLPLWYIAALQQAWAEGRDIRYGIIRHKIEPSMAFPDVFQQITRLPWRYWTVENRRDAGIGATYQHRMTQSPVVAQRIGQVWMGAEKALRLLWGTPVDPQALWLPLVAHWEFYRSHARVLSLDDQALHQIVAENPHQCQRSRAEQWLLIHHWDPQIWYPFHEGTGAMRRAPFWGMCSLVPSQAAQMADIDASWAYLAQARAISAIIAGAVSQALLISPEPPSMLILLLHSIHRVMPRSHFLRDLVATLWKRERAGIPGEEALRWVASTFHYYPWDHCIPNFLVVLIALFYARNDFQAAIGIVRTAGWDVPGNTLLTGAFMALDTSMPPDASLEPILSSAIESMVRHLRS